MKVVYIYNDSNRIIQCRIKFHNQTDCCLIIKTKNSKGIITPLVKDLLILPTKLRNGCNINVINTTDNVSILTIITSPEDNLEYFGIFAENMWINQLEYLIN